MARILVTGASGFVGAALTAAFLARGDEVWALDIASSKRMEALQAQYRSLRVLNGQIDEWPHVLGALEQARPATVVHCAAIVGVLASAEAPFSTIRVNIGGMLNLLEGMRVTGVKRLINLSTEEIYGHFTSDRITEEHPCRPLMPYGISKFAAEQLSRDFHSQHGIEAIHLRTCWVYGPGLPRPRPPKSLIDAALAERSLHLPTGADFRVDHVYIDDLVAGTLAAVDKSEHRYDAYHIASGASPSIAEMIEIMKEIVPGARLSAGSGPMRFDGRVDVVRKGALDISRARAELGYVPRFDLRAGLRSYVANLMTGA